MGEVHQYILKKAREADICEEWAEKLTNTTDVHELLDMYIAGIDFCLSNDFPSVTDLVRLAGAFLEEHGIYVDSEPTLINPKTVVLLGDTEAVVNVTDYHVSRIYATDLTLLTLTAEHNSFTVIDAIKDCHVDIFASGDAKVCVCLYDGATYSQSVSDNAIVKIIRKSNKY